MVGKNSATESTRNTAEERLLIEAAQRDPAKFGDLYEANFEIVYFYVLKRLGNRESAEELTSDVFHKALESLPKFSWRGVPFAAWLLRIASNVIADQRKRARRETHLADLDADIENSVPDRTELAQHSLEEAEHGGHLFRMINQLPVDQRRVIVLRFGEDKSIREIAQELGRTEGAVKQLQFRGLETLRSRMLMRGEQNV